MKFTLIEEARADRITPKFRKQLNKIVDKYNGWHEPAELRNLWDELNELGIEVLIMGSPNSVADDGAKSWNVPFTYNGERITNSMFIYSVYEGSNRSLRNEYNMYFS